MHIDGVISVVFFYMQVQILSSIKLTTCMHQIFIHVVQQYIIICLSCLIFCSQGDMLSYAVYASELYQKNLKNKILQI